jgi:hypothetical protein
MTAGTSSEMEKWMKYRIKKQVKLDDDKSYNILTGMKWEMRGRLNVFLKCERC